MNYGLQLYSVRDLAKEHYEEALRRVAEMGYSMVEPAGFFGLPANEVAAMLRHYGLTVCSTHVLLQRVFPTQGSRLDLLDRRQILSRLRHWGSSP